MQNNSFGTRKWQRKHTIPEKQTEKKWGDLRMVLGYYGAAAELQRGESRSHIAPWSPSDETEIKV